MLQTDPDSSLTALFAVVPTLLFQLRGAVDLPSFTQSKCGVVLLCFGPPPARWLIAVWCSDSDSPAKETLIWTAKHCVNVGVCDARPGPTPFLVLQGLKTLTPSGKGKINSLNSLRAIKWRCFS